MPVKVPCVCGRMLLVPTARAGTVVRCPKCGGRVDVPPLADTGSKATSPPPPPMASGSRSEAEAGEDESAAAAAVVGYEHDGGKLTTVIYLAVAAGLVALLGMLPAALEIVDHFRFLDDSPGIARWAWLLALLGTIQLAYAVYLVQLPDWSTVWVVALMWLVVAALYATVLGVVMLSSADNGVLQWLDLTQVPRGKSARWCFMMLSLNSLLTYLAGRASVRWHRAYRLVTGITTRGPA